MYDGLCLPQCPRNIANPLKTRSKCAKNKKAFALVIGMRWLLLGIVFFVLACESKTQISFGEDKDVLGYDGGGLDDYLVSEEGFFGDHDTIFLDEGVDVETQNGDETVDAFEAGDAFVYPDANFIHKMTATPVFSATEPYKMDESYQYLGGEKLREPNVTSLSWAQGVLFAGTAAGLYRFHDGEDKFIQVGEEAGLSGYIYDISRGTTWALEVAVCSGQGIFLVDTESFGVRKIGDMETPVVACECSGDHVYFSVSDGGLYVIDLSLSDTLVPLAGATETGVVRDIAIDEDRLVFLATEKGLFVYHPTAGFMLETKDDNRLLDDDLYAVRAKDGKLVIGSKQGVVVIEGENVEKRGFGPGELPLGDIVSLDFSEDFLLLGHKVGATSLVREQGKPLIQGQVNHYVSQRWLPSNDVRAVAIDDKGNQWIGTSKGISRISWVERTLKDVARYMEDLLDAHFWRLGFVSSDARANDPYTPTEWRVWDKDNDGLWTQMQIGAWCYAYSVTKNEEYYQKARRAMEMMFLQIDIPAVDFERVGLGRGFVTRSLVRDDEGAVFEDKKNRSNWHLVEYGGHQWYWKDDTSSDETTGHFFGYPIYYDLCAKDEAERREVAEHAAALARYIKRHGYRLVDLDGETTTYGHFEPERLAAAADGLQPCLEKASQQEDPAQAIAACIGSWHGEGWLNSIEILGHMLAAWHMTGDKEFYDAYEELYTTYKYSVISMPHAETFTITDKSIANHSDHELAMLAYHTLIRYEPNPERRERFIQGLLFLYEYEKGERNPLWTAFVSLLAGADKAEVEDGLRSLLEIPMDRRDWLVDNTHRKDALDWPDDRHGHKQFDRVFPYDEIGSVWWNMNLRKKVFGGDGRNFRGPMAWLLPYWAFVYAGLISDAE